MTDRTHEAQETAGTPPGDASADGPGPADAERTAAEGPAGSRLSRRGLFGALAAGAAGLAIGGAGGGAIAAKLAADTSGGHSGAAAEYPFFGAHQSGITTAAQDRMHFAAFDLDADATREELVDLLRRWSYAASRLVQGLDVSASGAVSGSPLTPPDDTGEALDLSPAGLTITIGFGPTLFEKDGEDRFGIAAQRPEPLQRLPRFTGDALVPERSDGDLCVQACSDDPQVAVHAIRNFTRMAFGTATLRWSQLGFGRTSSTSTSQKTPRNLFGFKDGTSNIKAEDPGVAEEQVWVQPGDGPAWLSGGSYLAARRIRMLIELWDRQQLLEQERVFGRDKREGAPLSGGTEFTPPDFAAPSADEASGDPTAIAAESHVALAHPDQNAGMRMLRRGYNYVDGNDELGRLDAGLFFLAFVRHPDQFIRVQQNLSGDLLNEYIKHVGSSLWAIPPGASEGGYVGETLFG
ncbi:MAG: iron uptake transporter deferrochelatase/peroxidase subunit [Pseudoclavibacter sp.]|nr:iron uptake transporter deferrochelatase/peroxidase subunit [Pseudoclavibacter sp.]